MSIPIQDSAPGQLAGGQAPLTERRGNESNQNMAFSGAKGTVQVDNDQPARTISPNVANGAGSRTPEDVSGMNAGSGRAINIRPVDRRTIEGSTPGDFRSKPGDVAGPSLNRAADNGGPRAGMNQFPNNGKTDQTSAFKSYPGNTSDSDAGN